MFNQEIEKKILEVIKKSPIGVTSSEIAKYLNLNRMTMAKYLAVIKEKALIDFKQFGMAKLWFIPVEINKEWFLNNLISELGAQLKDPSLIINSAVKIGENMVELYKGFYDAEKLNKDQIMESLADLGGKIGGSSRIADKKEDKFNVIINKCPFGDNIKLCPELCNVTVSLLGIFVSKNLGYCKICLKECIAKGKDSCLVEVHLKKNSEKGTEFGTA